MSTSHPQKKDTKANIKLTGATFTLVIGVDLDCFGEIRAKISGFFLGKGLPSDDYAYD